MVCEGGRILKLSVLMVCDGDRAFSGSKEPQTIGTPYQWFAKVVAFSKIVALQSS